MTEILECDRAAFPMPGDWQRVYPWQIVTKMLGVQLTARLPFSLDEAALLADFEAVVAKHAPRNHHALHHHDGGWRAIGLITAGGDMGENRRRRAMPFEKTEAMAACPHIESFLDSLPCEKRRVRFMALDPQRSIFWHYDRSDSIDRESVRLHAPVIVNPDAVSQLCHETYFWRPGELWYGDYSFPHRVFNGGTTRRVHLVIDLVVNDFVESLFPAWVRQQRARRELARYQAQKLYDLGDFPRKLRARYGRAVGEPQPEGHG